MTERALLTGVIRESFMEEMAYERTLEWVQCFRSFYYKILILQMDVNVFHWWKEQSELMDAGEILRIIQFIRV